MTLNIPSEYENVIRQAVANGAFARPEDALAHALQLFAQEQRENEFEKEQQRLALTAGEPMEGDLEAIREGLADVKAGRVTPLADFDREFRKEMGFSPRAES